jgi:hypothetical protein
VTSLGKLVRAPLAAWRFARQYSQHLPLAFDAIFSMQCAVTLIQGALRESGEQVIVLYVGRRINYVYLLRTLFDDYRLLQDVHTTLFACRKHVRAARGGADVEIVDIGWPYHRLINRQGRYLEVPDWVNLALEIPARWDDVVRNFRRTARKHDLRLIRRNDYRCEPARSREDVERFYDEMYLPFVRHRYPGDSVAAPRRHVVERALNGALLRVLRGDDVVAAGIVYPEDDVLYSLWMGMPRRHLDSPPEAAISALYYFALRYAFDRGYKAFDFTGTRAFLSDGAYQFKRRWGASVKDEFSPSSILIRPVSGGPKAALFFSRIPLLRRTADGLDAVFVSAEESPDEDAAGTVFERLQKDFGCDGLDRMTLIRISDERESEAAFSMGDGCRYRLIHCAADAFAECLVRGSVRAPAARAG